MKIKFYGGVKKVTGANYLVEAGKIKFLVDCGLIQGKNVCELENFEEFPYSAREINFVLITHAHLDHIGRLPKLFKEGFDGYIYSTLPTKDLAREIIMDSKKIVEENCLSFNKDSFYTEELIEKIFQRWKTIDYYKELKIDELKIKFYDAGHILGSAFIYINFQNEIITFSGDLGSQDSILKPTDELPETDYLILESTYGDRLHQNLESRKNILEDIVEETIREKRTLIIPAFALERSQEVLYDLISLIEDKKVPEITIFLDTPLGIRILNIYEKYYEYLNEEAKNFFIKRNYENLEYLKIIEEKNIYGIVNYPSPKIIISSSGMLKGGKIIPILKKFIEKEETTILFVGFQVEGSLGRNILEGQKEVIIDDENYQVKAKIEKLLSYSGHKDQKGIVEWVKPQRKRIKKIFLVQGEKEAKISLKIKLEDYLGIKTEIPEENEEFEL
ncbi:MAG: MBL fold metallo-hydrolase [Patescibacteria group bacterium]|nr:MBL fold metallo-hydrolase [Patescibacteria group bacterium]